MLKEAILVIGTPLLRATIGWASKSLKDRRITRLEWRKLVETILRVGLIASCEYGVVVGLFKVDLALVETVSLGGAAILTDKLFKAMKENKNVTNRG